MNLLEGVAYGYNPSDLRRDVPVEHSADMKQRAAHVLEHTAQQPHAVDRHLAADVHE